MTERGQFRLERSPVKYRPLRIRLRNRLSDWLISNIPVAPSRFFIQGWLPAGSTLEPPRPPDEALTDAPVDVAFYVGRVDDVAGDQVGVRLWEWPSGRELVATFSAAQHLAGEPPNPGSMLRIWTWLELPGNGREVSRHRVECEPKILSEEERSRLRAELEALVDGEA